ncbi:MAG: SagB family peptide dehydrogenase [Bdellovibrionales bacterium]|nr:SagB family peptide dehydrogenase [Bdellovibrionales bacterium]
MNWILHDPATRKKMRLGTNPSSRLAWKVWEESWKARAVTASLKGKGIEIRWVGAVSSEFFLKKSKSTEPWSRFVEIRPNARGFSIRTGLSNAQIQIRNLNDLVFLRSNLGGLLDALGFLKKPKEDQELRYWEEADLGFHRQSLEFERGPWGGTYRMGRPKPKASRNPRPEMRILLGSKKTGSLSSVIQKRASNRNFSHKAVSIQKLSRFLNQCFGIQGKKRPFASGGGIYEQQLYLAIADHPSIPPGFYRVNSGQSCLEKWKTENDSKLVLAWQQVALQNLAPSKVAPPIVGILTSRHALLAIKYERIAYRLSLLNAGCFLQAAALSAADLRLAFCPLGSVNPSLFEKTTKIKMMEESPVAAFALGEVGSN